MKKMILSLSAAICMTGLIQAGTFTVVQTYDENTHQTNTINNYAVQGAGLAGEVILSSDFAGWTSGLSTAATAGTGGVVNFDNASFASVDTTIASDGSDPIATFLFSGSPILSANQTAITGLSGGAGSANQPNGLPGGIAYYHNNTSGIAGVTISMSGAANDVDTFGITLLSRTSRSYDNVTATATFGDATTATATSNVGGGAGLDDTFFGFDSQGKGIDSVTFTWTGSTTYTAFDDLGFTTIPEPSTLVLMMGSFLACLGLLRKRR